MQNTTALTLYFLAIAGIPIWIFLATKAIQGARAIWASPQPYRKISRFFPVAMLFFSVVHYAWGWFSATGSWYWATYYPMSWVWFIGIWAGLAVSLIGVVLTRLHWKYAILLLLNMGLVCAGTLSAFFGATHLNSAQLGEHQYHLARYLDSHGLWRYKLCECDNTGSWCDCHFFYRNSYHREPTAMIVDNTAHELHIQIGGKLVYTYGPQPRCHVEGCWISK